MKKLFLFMVGIMLFTLPSQAQLVRSRTFAKKERTGFNRISVGYEAMFFNDVLKTMDGVNMQYIHGFRVTKSPLFIETGVHISYNLYNDWDDNHYFYYTYNQFKEANYKCFKEECVSFSVPLGISYRFQFGEKFSIQPYAGVNFIVRPHNYFRFYREKYITDTDVLETSRMWHYFKICQMGGQIGLGLNISRLYLGVHYDIDFVPISTNMIITRFPYDYSGDYPWEVESQDSKPYRIRSSRLSLNIGINF